MTQASSSRDGERFQSADSTAAVRKLRQMTKSARPSRRGLVRTLQAKVKAVNEETLSVVLVTGNGVDGYTEQGSAFEVARPYEHRKTTYDGKTFNGFLHTFVDVNTRTAEKSGETTETHKITPDYRLDDSIISISKHDVPLMNDSGGDPVFWQADPDRQWAIEP